MVYVKVSDVATEVGRTLDPAESNQVDAWVSRVESRILARIPDLDERADGPGYMARLVGVVVDVVARKLRNPDGFRSERIDDYYYDRGNQSADLTLTDGEWAELGAFGSGGAFSTRPRFDPDGGDRWP